MLVDMKNYQKERKNTKNVNPTIKKTTILLFSVHKTLDFKANSYLDF